MKTISLTDEAYERLKSWKSGPSDSFSKVVLKSVPKRGTAADMLNEAEKLPMMTEDESKAIGESIRWSNRWNSTNEVEPS